MMRLRTVLEVAFARRQCREVTNEGDELPGVRDRVFGPLRQASRSSACRPESRMNRIYAHHSWFGDIGADTPHGCGHQAAYSSLSRESEGTQGQPGIPQGDVEVSWDAQQIHDDSAEPQANNPSADSRRDNEPHLASSDSPTICQAQALYLLSYVR